MESNLQWYLYNNIIKKVLFISARGHKVGLGPGWSAETPKADRRDPSLVSCKRRSNCPVEHPTTLSLTPSDTREFKIIHQNVLEFLYGAPVKYNEVILETHFCERSPYASYSYRWLLRGFGSSETTSPVISYQLRIPRKVIYQWLLLTIIFLNLKMLKNITLTKNSRF